MDFTLIQLPRSRRHKLDYVAKPDTRSGGCVQNSGGSSRGDSIVSSDAFMGGSAGVQAGKISEASTRSSRAALAALCIAPKPAEVSSTASRLAAVLPHRSRDLVLFLLVPIAVSGAVATLICRWRSGRCRLCLGTVFVARLRRGRWCWRHWPGSRCRRRGWRWRRRFPARFGNRRADRSIRRRILRLRS